MQTLSHVPWEQGPFQNLSFKGRTGLEGDRGLGACFGYTEEKGHILPVVILTVALYGFWEAMGLLNMRTGDQTELSFRANPFVS